MLTYSVFLHRDCKQGLNIRRFAFVENTCKINIILSLQNIMTLYLDLYQIEKLNYSEVIQDNIEL